MNAGRGRDVGRDEPDTLADLALSGARFRLRLPSPLKVHTHLHGSRRKKACAAQCTVAMHTIHLRQHATAAVTGEGTLLSPG